MGAEVLTLVTGIVAVDEIEGSGIVAEGAEGDGCAGGIVFATTGADRLVADLVIHPRLFHAPEAQLAPSRRGHHFDEGAFDRCLGLELFDEIVEDFQEPLFNFALEHDRGGEQAVFDRIAGGIVFAFGRDGPAGSGSVSTGGLDLTFCSHFDFVIALVRDHGRIR
jgi:hypothetical protein